MRGGGGIARRQTGVAFGVSLFVLAVKYGLLFGGIERPRWVVHGLTLLFVLSVVWSIIESRREGTNAVRAASANVAVTGTLAAIAAGALRGIFTPYTGPG